MQTGQDQRRRIAHILQAKRSRSLGREQPSGDGEKTHRSKIFSMIDKVHHRAVPRALELCWIPVKDFHSLCFDLAQFEQNQFDFA